LANEIESLTKTHFEQCGKVTEWKRKRLEGEANLMLIEAFVGGGLGSLGVRNGGTQGKIGVSLRRSCGMPHQKLSLVVPLLTEKLSRAMK